MKYSRNLALIVCTFALLLLMISSSTLGFAQAGRGGLNGLVTDPSGAVVPGAKVILLDHATGVKQSAVTTGAGLYSFVSLNPENTRSR